MYTKTINVGLYGITHRVTVTYERRLREMPYASAGVRKLCDGRVILTSYQTDVCEITRDGWLYVWGLYGNTTRRHISAFLKEYGRGMNIGFDAARLCYNEGLRYNIETGEVESL